MSQYISATFLNGLIVIISIKLWVPGTIKRQKGHFVHVESTTNFIERKSQKHMILRLPLYYLFYADKSVVLSFVVPDTIAFQVKKLKFVVEGVIYLLLECR
jgi:hypothetical protein